MHEYTPQPPPPHVLRRPRLYVARDNRRKRKEKKMYIEKLATIGVEYNGFGTFCVVTKKKRNSPRSSSIYFCGRMNTTRHTLVNRVSIYNKTRIVTVYYHVRGINNCHYYYNTRIVRTDPCVVYEKRDEKKYTCKSVA